MKDGKSYYRPGQTVPISSIYWKISPFGENTGRQVVCVRGEPFPPSPKQGYSYLLAQAAIHNYNYFLGRLEAATKAICSLVPFP